MVLKISSNPQELEKIISEAKPEDILGTLRELTNQLYETRGDLDSWRNPNYIKRKEAWESQDKLRNLYFILFTTKHEDKIKELYKLITKKEPNSFDYSAFYIQLYETVNYISNQTYGLNRVRADNKIDFPDYIWNLTMFKYLLELGPRDWSVYKKHEGIFNQEIQKKSLPPEER